MVRLLCTSKSIRPNWLFNTPKGEIHRSKLLKQNLYGLTNYYPNLTVSC